MERAVGSAQIKNKCIVPTALRVYYRISSQRIKIRCYKIDRADGANDHLPTTATRKTSELHPIFIILFYICLQNNYICVTKRNCSKFYKK